MTATRDCSPDSELIATYIDGNLEGEEKARLEHHLSECNHCRELMTESFRMLNGRSTHEQPSTRAPLHAAAPQHPSDTVLPVEPRWDGGTLVRRWLLAAALLLALGIGAWWTARTLSPSMSSAAQVAYLPSAGALVALINEGWVDHRWSSNRGHSSVTASAAAAFQLGVRSSDLAAALRSQDQSTIELVSLRIQQLLANVTDTDAATLQLTSILLSNMLEAGVDLDDVREQARLLDQQLQIVEPALYVEIGRWASVGHLAALAKDPAYFRSKQWKTGIAMLRAGTPTGRLASIPSALENLHSTQFDEIESALGELLRDLSTGREELAAAGLTQ